MNTAAWICTVLFVYAVCCLTLWLGAYVIAPRLEANKHLEWRITHGEKVHVLYTIEDVETDEKYKGGEKFKVVSNMQFVGIIQLKAISKIYVYERIAMLKGRACKITYYADDCYGEESFDYLEPAGVVLGLSYAKTIYQST